MARRARIIVHAIMLLSLLATLPTPAFASQPSASPVASPIPGLTLGKGVSVTIVASGTADQVPGGGPLMLERITLPPGASTGMRQLSAPELLVVEAGPVTAVDSLGLQSTLNTGGQALLASNATYEVRNTGTSEVSFLRLRLSEANAVPSSNPAPTVVATPAAAPTTTVLFQGQNMTFPAGASMLFVARATYAPGADTGPHAYAGPVGLFVVSGALSISSPSGLTGQLSTGKGIVLPAGTVDREQNQGGQPAQVLLAGVVPGGQPLAKTTTPTPAPTATPTETPIPTETPVPTDTPQPTSTPIPTPTPTPVLGTVVYQTTTAGGFDRWPLSTGWKRYNGMLLNDGSTTGSSIMAPVDLGSRVDYVVEAQIQMVGEDCSSTNDDFGIAVRVGQQTPFFAGYNCDGTVAIWGGGVSGDKSLANKQFKPGSAWHDYVLEVKGNEISLMIDGTLIAQATDNRLISDTGGGVGLFSDAVQINVRNFGVFTQ